MRYDKALAGFFIFFIVISVLLFVGGRIIHAQGSYPDSVIAQKLDEILANQKSIIHGIESLKSELNIVKIRVTQQQ